MVSTIEAVHFGPCFDHVRNDRDPYWKVTEVNILNKSWICLVVRYVVIGTGRLYSCQMMHLM